MLACGLLGEHLKHSFSPQIHKYFGDYNYSLFEVEKNNLSAFMSMQNFDGINVTIPYKKAVVPFLTELSTVAKKLGSVNTVVKRPDGTLFGDNTDYYGFINLLKHESIDVKEKKVLVLGSGGAAASVTAAIESLGGNYVVISRNGENNYNNLYLHYDAKVIVNTTPVGMFPENGMSPINLNQFKNLESVVDIIYNPLKTKLILDAESMGIKAANGLYMLVSQAAGSSELFTGEKITEEKTEDVYKTLLLKCQNIVLIGMPGCGKTSIAKALGERLNREIVDTDAVLENKINMTISQYFKTHTEEQFRKLESEVIKETGKRSGIIISTGGGCVTVAENFSPLHQNGIIVFIKRNIDSLSKDNRPLSKRNNLYDMYKVRKSLYNSFADITIENNSTIDYAVDKILEAL